MGSIRWQRILEKMSGEMRKFAVTHDDMDLPNEIVLPFIMNFITGNLTEISPVNNTSADLPSRVCLKERTSYP